MNDSLMEQMRAHTVQVQDLLFVRRFIIAPSYMILFLIGICGNIWVMWVVGQIFRTAGRSVSWSSQQHVFFYIVSLSVVDTLVLLCIPFVVSDILADQWPFGFWICKIYMGVENINKILSTFILAAVSFDRFMAVCFPFAQRHNSPRFAAGVVAGATVCSALLLMPINLSSTARIPVKNGTDVKCITDMTGVERKTFLGYIFLIGFAIPALLITAFYSLIMARIFGHRRSMLVTYNAGSKRESRSDSKASTTGLDIDAAQPTKKTSTTRSQIPIRKVAMSCLMVVGFYYAVWTPYWMVMIYAFFISSPDGVMSRKYGFVIMNCVHTLPYVNSAFNWIFYALLNRQLRVMHTNALQEIHRLSIQQEKRYSVVATAGRTEPATRTQLFGGSGGSPGCRRLLSPADDNNLDGGDGCMSHSGSRVSFAIVDNSMTTAKKETLVTTTTIC